MKTQMYNVVEIFKSIEGEGKRAGVPATFIRLYGCNLRCSYCDTMYGVEGNQYNRMSLDEILNVCYTFDLRHVTVTGGEPLIQPNIKELILELARNGFEVNIETNGAVDISPYSLASNVFITMDYKCPSSGMEDKMLLVNFSYLRKKDVLKFVVGSMEDLERARQLINEYYLTFSCNVYFSPVFGNIEPKTIVEYVLDHPELSNAYVQVQLHKIIWDPEQRGV